MARKYKTFAEVPTALPSVMVGFHSNHNEFTTRVCCEYVDGRYKYYATLRHGDFVRFLAKYLGVEHSSSLDESGHRQETTKEKVVSKLAKCATERYVVCSERPRATDKAPFSMLLCLDDLKRHPSFKQSADFSGFYSTARELASTVCKKVAAASKPEPSTPNTVTDSTKTEDAAPSTVPEAPVALQEPYRPETDRLPSSAQELLENIRRPLLDQIADLQEQLKSKVDWPAEILAVHRASPAQRVELWTALVALASMYSGK